MILRSQATLFKEEIGREPLGAASDLQQAHSRIPCENAHTRCGAQRQN
jgi:hypothetical protein